MPQRARIGNGFGEVRVFGFTEESAMGDKQKALELIDQSVKAFEVLVENPPSDYLAWNDQQHEAARPLDEAHTLWARMTGRDQAEVRDAWVAATVRIERILATEGLADTADETGEDDGYEPVEADDEFDVDASAASTTSDKQRALDLIEAARQGYRSLLREPPKDDADYRARKGKADWQQAEADMIVRRLLEDYRTVADMFSMVNEQIEVMDAKIGAVGSNAEQYLEETESWDPLGVDEEEPEEALPADDRAESTMSDRQKALDLIDQTLQVYRRLVKHRPGDYADYTTRTHQADDLLDQADSRIRALTGSDFTEAAVVFRQANDDIVQMIRKIGSPQAEEDAEEPREPEDEPGVDEDAPGAGENELADVLDADARTESTMSDKQKALGLIERSVQGYRDLVKNPPKDDADFMERRGRADAAIDDAQTILSGLRGQDRNEVVAAFGHGHAVITSLVSKIRVTGNDEEDPEPAEDAPEDELNDDDRAELYSALVHDPFDGEPDDRPQDKD